MWRALARHIVKSFMEGPIGRNSANYSYSERVTANGRRDYNTAFPSRQIQFALKLLL